MCELAFCEWLHGLAVDSTTCCIQMVCTALCAANHKLCSLSLSLTVSDHTRWLCYHLPGPTQLDCTALCASNHALYSLALALTHLYYLFVLF
jgi:hypothetical protein